MKAFRILLLLGFIGIVFAKTTVNQRAGTECNNDAGLSGLLGSSGLSGLVTSLIAMFQKFIQMMPTLGDIPNSIQEIMEFLGIANIPI
ncbi:hypothetical protein ALC62_12312 [Cyphomyrmex costatus]|uniref:Uncharacterized protein n=1 Tax=Cyphomyrmex costatus TaxID=456900 RepID=A0A151IBM8_9HYME|nr:hypothetical protein ALC62_12312 [Cyphomyrmex costatus]